jgi:hypothetical protein
MLRDAFYKELEEYDINYRTAESMYEIIKNNKEYLKLSDEDIASSYRKWYSCFGKHPDDVAEYSKTSVIVFHIIKKFIVSGGTLDNETSLYTPWGDEYIGLWHEPTETEVMIKPLTEDVDIFELKRRLNCVLTNKYKITIRGFLCPVCGSPYNVGGGCWTCGTIIRDYNMIANNCELASKEDLLKW